MMMATVILLLRVANYPNLPGMGCEESLGLSVLKLGESWGYGDELVTLLPLITTATITAIITAASSVLCYIRFK